MHDCAFRFRLCQLIDHACCATTTGYLAYPSHPSAPETPESPPTCGEILPLLETASHCLIKGPVIRGYRVLSLFFSYLTIYGRDAQGNATGWGDIVQLLIGTVLLNTWSFLYAGADGVDFKSICYEQIKAFISFNLSKGFGK